MGEVIEPVGGVASTMNVTVAIGSLMLPTSSVAVMRKVCDPWASSLKVIDGRWHAVNGALSSAHRNVTMSPVGLVLNVTTVVGHVTWFGVGDEITTTGGSASTSQVTLAGCGLGLSNESNPVTTRVCVPVGRSNATCVVHGIGTLS